MKIDVLNNLARDFDRMAAKCLEEKDYLTAQFYDGASYGVKSALTLITKGEK